MLQNICGTSTSHHLYKTNAPDMLIKSMGKNPYGKELIPSGRFTGVFC